MVLCYAKVRRFWVPSAAWCGYCCVCCRLPNLEQGKHQGLGSKLVSLLAERAEVLRHKLAQFVSVGNLSDLGQAMQRVVSHVTG